MNLQFKLDRYLRFSEKNIGLRRPGNGLKPIMLKKILGQISKQKIVKGRLIELGDFENIRQQFHIAYLYESLSHLQQGYLLHYPWI